MISTDFVLLSDRNITGESKKEEKKPTNNINSVDALPVSLKLQILSFLDQGTTLSCQITIKDLNLPHYHPILLKRSFCRLLNSTKSMLLN